MTRISVFLASLILCLSGAARAQLLTPEDQEAYRAAFAAARANDWTTAGQIADRAKERLPAKILHWLELTRSGNATFADLVAFADANRDWPLQSALRERAEDASADVPDGELLAYFQRNRPTTPKGKLRFADLLAGSGQGEAATELIRATWLATDLDPDTERAILDRYAAALRPSDHVARLDRLIWAGQSSAAGRLLGLVPEEQRLVAEARLGLADLRPDAQELVSRVPPQLREDPGLLFEEARWYRRKDQVEEAARVLLGAPSGLQRPAAWWSERQIVARRLVEQGKDKLAYDLLSQPVPGEQSGAHAEDDFLAGWIALRRLGEPQAGYEHFTRLYQAAKLPISRSRDAYWAGRAAEALGAGGDPQRWFAAAADYETTYYAELAAARLGRATSPRVAPDPPVSPDDIAHFDANELVRAVRMLAEIGGDEIGKPFLLRLSAAAATPAEQKLIATLADATHHPDVAIAAAKRAAPDGLPPLELSFPVVPVQGDGSVEKPLILAIVRQESAFDTLATSGADARGLMQLQPATAKQVAKSLSLPFSAGRLLTDPTYNVTLGYSYFERMLDKFSGSYVLSIAAYNAGPARVAQWVNDYGDPRTAAIDVADWIELIPFGETRNYVQRVLENLQIYRLRLGDRERAFTLARDIKR